MDKLYLSGKICEVVPPLQTRCFFFTFALFALRSQRFLLCEAYWLPPIIKPCKLDFVTQSYKLDFVTLTRDVKMSEIKKKHGGARPGAGRKTKYESTIVMRVPEQYRDAIKALIAHLDDTAMIDKYYLAAESEPQFLRSLKDKPQHITFKTESVKK